MTSRKLVGVRPVARLAALLGTSYFLIATSQYEPTSYHDVCNHPTQSVAFHVTGTCGPEGDVTMISLANDCAISVQGGGAVGLPTAGRFASAPGTTVSLTSNAWSLSGYLQEGSSLPSNAYRDAGFFTVQNDAQVNADSGFSTSGGNQTPTVTHGSLVRRECDNSSASPLFASCLDQSTASSCQAQLTVKK